MARPFEPSCLDGNQVLQHAFDDAKGCLRVCIIDGSPGTGGGIEVIIDHTEDSIRLGDGTNFFTSTQEGSKLGLDVNIITPIDISVDAVDGDNLALADESGNKVTVTDVGADTGLDVYLIGGDITGEVTIAGVNGPLKTHVVPITDVPVKIIATPQAGRNSISIRVWQNDTVYFSENNTVGINGYPKRRFEEFILDISDQVVEFYAVCDNNRTSELRILELA